MNITTDKLLRELETFDPVRPGELESDRDGAEELLQRVLLAERGGGRDDREAPPHGGFRPGAIPVLAVLATAAVALMVLLVGLPGGDGGDSDLGATLGRAATAAATQSLPVAALPYTFLKTKEIAMDTKVAGKRSWSVYQRTTRDEWVGWDGSGRLRVVTAPERFVGPADRAEWEAAGSPRVFGLGAERRVEDRWLEAGLLDPSVEELPIGVTALAARLRDEAAADHGSTPVPAAILERIADDLRSPAASPELREALYRAASLTPGVEYLGRTTDPQGRSGSAIGVTGSYRGVPAVYSLVFDPRTARVLASETASLEASGDGQAGPSLLRATVYLGSRGTGSPSHGDGTWLSDYEPSAHGRRPTSPFLVYRVPDRGTWSG